MHIILLIHTASLYVQCHKSVPLNVMYYMNLTPFHDKGNFVKQLKSFTFFVVFSFNF